MHPKIQKMAVKVESDITLSIVQIRWLHITSGLFRSQYKRDFITNVKMPCYLPAVLPWKLKYTHIMQLISLLNSTYFYPKASRMFQLYTSQEQAKVSKCIYAQWWRWGFSWPEFGIILKFIQTQMAVEPHFRSLQVVCKPVIADKTWK